MSPAATVLYTAVTFVDDDGVDRYGYAQVPTDAPGVEICGDWDALGMRASGSHSVAFAGVRAAALGAARRLPRRRRRRLHGAQPRRRALPRLGLARHRRVAAAAAAGALAARGEPDARARTLLAQNVVDLGAARATLSRSALLVDDHDQDPVPLFAETQAAKTFVNEASARIVERALALSGGAGYLNGHPLARAYRDVRAGGFMHPLGANRAYELLGDVALGRDLVLH